MRGKFSCSVQEPIRPLSAERLSYERQQHVSEDVGGGSGGAGGGEGGWWGRGDEVFDNEFVRGWRTEQWKNIAA